MSRAATAAALTRHTRAVHQAIAASHEKLRRGLVWCTTCGATLRVDSAAALRTGWPKCCGYTMTIDSPEEP